VTVGLMLGAPVVALVAAANSHPVAGFAFGVICALASGALELLTRCPYCNSMVLHRSPQFFGFRFVPPERCPVCKRSLTEPKAPV
jgi:uncharacterized protein with PIN domain